MSSLLTPLREEHEELRVWIDGLRDTADRIGEVSIGILRELVEETYEFLTHHLIPHAFAEDEVLYPVVARLMGAPRATETMSRDHVEVARLTEELRVLLPRLASTTPGDNQAKALRRILYGLHTLVSVHFSKEEEVYVPILEAGLSEKEATAIFARMEEAERVARGRAAEHAVPGSRSLPA